MITPKGGYAAKHTQFFTLCLATPKQNEVSVSSDSIHIIPGQKYGLFLNLFYKYSDSVASAHIYGANLKHHIHQ